MSKPGQRDLVKERFWRTTFAQFERSGLTVRAFCAWHKLTESQFYFWRQLLKRRDQQDDAKPTEASSQATTFIPVHVTPPISPAESHIDIQLTDPVSVRLTGPVDVQALARVLAVLREERT